MTTTHHRIKTFAHWRAAQPYPGIFVWRDPHGAFYLQRPHRQPPHQPAPAP